MNIKPKIKQEVNYWIKELKKLFPINKQKNHNKTCICRDCLFINKKD